MFFPLGRDSGCLLTSEWFLRDYKGSSPLPLEDLAEVLQGGGRGPRGRTKALPAAPSSLPLPEPLLSSCPCCSHKFFLGEH